MKRLTLVVCTLALLVSLVSLSYSVYTIVKVKALLDDTQHERALHECKESRGIQWCVKGKGWS